MLMRCCHHQTRYKILQNVFIPRFPAFPAFPASLRARFPASSLPFRRSVTYLCHFSLVKQNAHLVDAVMDLPSDSDLRRRLLACPVIVDRFDKFKAAYRAALSARSERRRVDSGSSHGMTMGTALLIYEQVETRNHPINRRS